MTREEFAGWKRVTERSKAQWQYCAITRHNRGEFLFYKGGVDGHFICVDADGNIQCGIYDGAIPHIGDAGFKILSSKKHESQAVALEKLYRVLPALRTAPPDARVVD